MLEKEEQEREREEEESKKKQSRKKLFSSGMDIEEVQLRPKLVNYIKIYLSDRCPHCLKFSGMLFREGLKTLFLKDCVLRRALLQEKWDISELKVEMKYIYDSRHSELVKTELGKASLEKIYTTKTAVEKLVRDLERQVSLRDNYNLIHLLQLEREGFNLLVERIYFINASVLTEELRYAYSTTVPFIIAPLALQGEHAVSEYTTERDLRALLFHSSEYNLSRHSTFEKGKKVDWDSVLAKNVLKATRGR
jgi:hypothetical protein